MNTLTNIEDLGEKLNGSIVTHNHPVGSDNEYSFSDADLKLFLEYKLARLRGVDEKFIYEFNRNAKDLDSAKVTLDDYNYKHWDNIRRAKALKIGYRRWAK